MRAHRYCIFTEDTARHKVQAAEDAWNTRNPERVGHAYTKDPDELGYTKFRYASID